jgi:hypothetical protein
MGGHRVIETHVVNATIQKEIAEASWFDIINFINGLVAPSFLFASGMAYAVTTRRKLDSYLSFGTPLFRQLWRLLFVLLLAYALHLPKFNLGQMLEEVTEGQWLVFYQSDVLHCIAVSLLFLQIVLLTVRTERRFYRTVAVVAVAILFATPFVWGVDSRNIPASGGIHERATLLTLSALPLVCLPLRGRYRRLPVQRIHETRIACG